MEDTTRMRHRCRWRIGAITTLVHATRLLLPTLHDRLREHLGSPFLAGVPNRDILLCFRNDDETVSRLKGQIGEDFRSMPNSISDQLVLVTADGVAAFQAPKNEE